MVRGGTVTTGEELLVVYARNLFVKVPKGTKGTLDFVFNGEVAVTSDWFTFENVGDLYFLDKSEDFTWLRVNTAGRVDYDSRFGLTVMGGIMSTFGIRDSLGKEIEWIATVSFLSPDKSQGDPLNSRSFQAAMSSQLRVVYDAESRTLSVTRCHT